MAKTKIICTLGPSSNDVTTLRKMMRSGMDVARLNFSHGTHREHQGRIDIIRKLNKKYHRHVRIMQDLEGFRIRVCKFPNRNKKEIALKKRQIIFLTNQKSSCGDKVIPFDYKGPLRDIKKDSFVYIDDGNIALKVMSVSKRHLKTEVIVPGIVKENKGVNIPDIKLKFKDLTDKDRIDLNFGVKNKVDFIAQSFVRNKNDIINVRRFIRHHRVQPKIIAKIENPDGIKNADSILDVADGLMVARGDMGVSIPIYEVPVVQKILIRKCNRRKKIVITATQMLESMTEHVRPTRAEVSDVANAIIDGSQYVMLSGETAAGLYPVETVQMMNNIIKFTEPFLR